MAQIYERQSNLLVPYGWASCIGLCSLGVVESLHDLVLRAQHGELSCPCSVMGTVFGFVPIAVAARDGSGRWQWAGQGCGLLNLHWAEQQGGASSSCSLPGTRFICHGWLTALVLLPGRDGVQPVARLPAALRAPHETSPVT